MVLLPVRLFWLLRPRRERPGRCAAEQRDERAAVHSITSSARPSSVIGKVRPSVHSLDPLLSESSEGLFDLTLGGRVQHHDSLPDPLRRRLHLVRAMALPRGGGHAAIGPGQRELSLKRLFGHEHDAQWGALPRCPRREQERDLARRVTGGRRALGPRVPRRESQKECAGNQRQRCRCSPNELACRKHWQSLAPGRARRHNWLKSWQKSIGHADFGLPAPAARAPRAAMPLRC